MLTSRGRIRVVLAVLLLLILVVPLVMYWTGMLASIPSFTFFTGTVLAFIPFGILGLIVLDLVTGTSHARPLSAALLTALGGLLGAMPFLVLTSGGVLSRVIGFMGLSLVILGVLLFARASQGAEHSP